MHKQNNTVQQNNKHKVHLQLSSKQDLKHLQKI